MLEAEERAVVFSLHTLQACVTVAKLIVGLSSLLSPVWHLQVYSWPGSTGIHGATEAASPNSCKLDLTWIFSVFYCLKLRSSEEADKNNTKLRPSPMETPVSNDSSTWKLFSVFMRNNCDISTSWENSASVCSDSGFVFVPQTSENIMEISFSVSFHTE